METTQVYFSAPDTLSPRSRRSRCHHGCVLVTVYWWQPSSWFIAGNFSLCPGARDLSGTTFMKGHSFHSGELYPLFRIPEGLLPNSLIFGVRCQHMGGHKYSDHSRCHSREQTVLCSLAEFLYSVCCEISRRSRSFSDRPTTSASAAYSLLLAGA